MLISMQKQVRHAKDKFAHVYRLPSSGVDVTSTTWAVVRPSHLDHSSVDLSFAHLKPGFVQNHLFVLSS